MRDLPSSRFRLDRWVLWQPWSVVIVFALVALVGEVVEHEPHSLSDLDPHFWIEFSLYVLVFPVIVGVILNLLARARAHSITAPKIAVEQERRRLARDLHDSLGHNLGYLHLKLDQLASDPRLQDYSLAQELEGMREVADEAYTQLRGALATLKTGGATDLATALMEYACVMSERAGLRVQVVSEGHAKSLSPQVRNEILNLFREALVNVEKHARAKQVDLRLTWTADLLTVELTDDGRGFDLETFQPQDQFGLVFMRERAQNIGSQLLIESQPACGTRLVLQLALGEKSQQPDGPDTPADR